MKKFFSILFAGILILPVVVSGQTGQYFEFQLTMGNGTNAGNMKMYHSAAGSRSEITMSVAGAGTMNMVALSNTANPGKYFLLNDRNKTYTEMTPGAASNTKASTPVVTVVGNEKVGSWNAVHVKVKDGTEEYEMWTSKEVGDLAMASYLFKDDYNAEQLGGLAKALKDKGAEGFPVKMVQTDHGETITNTLVKYETQTMANSLFEIPAGYTQQGTPGMQGVPGMPPNFQNMSPEDQQKYIQQLQKQYAPPGGN